MHVWNDIIPNLWTIQNIVIILSLVMIACLFRTFFIFIDKGTNLSLLTLTRPFLSLAHVWSMVDLFFIRQNKYFRFVSLKKEANVW